MSSRLSVAIRAALLGSLAVVPMAHAAPQGAIRLDAPDAQQRALLPPSALDYGGFVWIPAADAGPLAEADAALSKPDAFHLRLAERSFDPLTEFPSEDSAWLARSQAEGPDFHLVQFAGPIRPEWLQKLRATGLEPVQYIHPYSYVVWGSIEQREGARSLQPVRWAGDFLPAFRVPVQAREYPDPHREAMLMVYRPKAAELRAEIEALGIRVHALTAMDGVFSVIYAEASADRFLELARLPGVYTVQQISQDAGPRGEMSNQAVVGAYSGPNNTIVPGYEDWLDAVGVDGAGVVVGIVDGGIRTTHQDLASRMLPCVSAGGSPTTCTSSNDSHGTHVAGAVAGTGASGIRNAAGFLRGQGVAPGASLVQQRYNPFIGSGPGGMIPNGMLTIFRESALSNAVLTNNSWGPSSTPQGYNAPTRQIDVISRDALSDVPGQQPVLAVWSVMNGNGDRNTGPCAPSSLGAPDEAKNLFGVGSTKLQNANGTQIPEIFDLSSNSGHGPTCDGRLGVAIVAPGCRTDAPSAGGDTAFALQCGTSMASPVVSGAVALFIEQFRRDNDGATPSPALVKAVFTAAARNLHGFRDANNRVMGHRPNRMQGWGKLDLDAVVNRQVPLWVHDQEHVFEVSGESWTQVLTPQDPDQPLRIMLAWSDAPGHGTGGTTPAWVNDLDLIVEVGSATYRGNVFDSQTGWSATGGTADGRNNLEGVMLSPAQHGGQPVTVTVQASNIAADALDPWSPGDPRQDFALACFNCLGQPDYTFSLGASQLELCAPDAASVEVEIGSVLGYDTPVALSLGPLPDGIDALLDPDLVTPPGSATLDLTVAADADPGPRTLDVLAEAQTESPRVRVLGLNVATLAPADLELLGPQDAATDVDLQPTFEWSSVAQASSYRFELATDPGFADPIADETLTATSWTPSSPLPSRTRFWWRVTAINGCGSEISAVSSFSTLALRGECAVDRFPVASFRDDVESGVGGWTVPTGGGAIGTTWQRSQARAASGQWSWHAVNPATISDQRLVSPPIELPPPQLGPVTLSFMNYQAMEQASTGNACWDGGILELSADGGQTWTQIPDALLLSQPYTGTVNNFASGPNPLAGLRAWCGDPTPWTLNRVDLDDWAGQTVQLRFRLGSDSTIGREGWYIDDIRINACAGERIFADGFEGEKD